MSLIDISISNIYDNIINNIKNNTLIQSNANANANSNSITKLSLNSYINLINLDANIDNNDWHNFNFQQNTIINPRTDKRCLSNQQQTSFDINKLKNKYAFSIYIMCGSNNNNDLTINNAIIKENLMKWIISVHRMYPTIDKIVLTQQQCCDKIKLIYKDALNTLNIQQLCFIFKHIYIYAILISSCITCFFFLFNFSLQYFA